MNSCRREPCGNARKSDRATERANRCKLNSCVLWVMRGSVRRPRRVGVAPGLRAIGFLNACGLSPNACPRSSNSNAV